MNLSKSLLIIALITSNIKVIAQDFQSIKDYRASFSIANDGTKQLIAYRSFTNENQKYLLLLNPETLNTKTDLANKYTLSNITFPNLLSAFKNTPYVRSMEEAASRDIPLQNAGIDHAIPKEKGITLTIDLCPSHKPLDRIIFQSVFDEFKKIEQPAPLAVSVSGKWMLKHQDDLNWLKRLVEKQELNITWVNHSYNHEVNNSPLAENFLLAPGTKLDIEVLENEKLMLKNGLTPSVFFRFPGLVSDQTIVEKIEAYGLIPVGSDAWLAKGQQPNAGSIVLIHGNGNEEIGVKDFIELLKNRRPDVINKQWLLFDLRQGLQQQYK